MKVLMSYQGKILNCDFISKYTITPYADKFYLGVSMSDGGDDRILSGITEDVAKAKLAEIYEYLRTV